MSTITPAVGGGGPATMLDERFVAALGYTARVHREQTRRNRPYVAHLLRVAGLVLEDGGSEDEAIAALLHDAVEDQGGWGRLRDIRRHYGDEVADIVASCTDNLDEPELDWHMRKQHYIEHLPEASSSALRVSLADKVDNVRGILHDMNAQGRSASSLSCGAEAGLDERRDAAEVCWYYAALARMFGLLMPGPRADELSALVAELEHRIALR